MNGHGPWRTDDFEALSWHDAHVHGLHLDAFKPGEGAADLSLDIDYILEWKNVEARFEFTVARATLRFHDVFGLKMRLDYESPTAGMSPFAIDYIERELIERKYGGETYRWTVAINWPVGSIEFQSPGFTQTLVGGPHVQGQQWLEEKDRDAPSAA